MTKYRLNFGCSEYQGSLVGHHLANPGSLEWFVVPVGQTVCQSATNKSTYLRTCTKRHEEEKNDDNFNSGVNYAFM